MAIKSARIERIRSSSRWAAANSAAALTFKAELKKLVPEDAKEATGHGLRAKRSKSGAVSFEVMEMEAADAPLQ